MKNILRLLIVSMTFAHAPTEIYFAVIRESNGEAFVRAFINPTDGDQSHLNNGRPCQIPDSDSTLSVGQIRWKDLKTCLNDSVNQGLIHYKKCYSTDDDERDRSDIICLSEYANYVLLKIHNGLLGYWSNYIKTIANRSGPEDLKELFSSLGDLCTKIFDKKIEGIRAEKCTQNKKNLNQV